MSEIIKDVSAYMGVVLKRNANHKKIDLEKVIKNAKDMFRDGVKNNDNLWMQHTASSLREIICLVN